MSVTIIEETKQCFNAEVKSRTYSSDFENHKIKFSPRV